MHNESIHEPSAETAILSSLCHAPSDVQKEILSQIREDHFHLIEHKLIFKAITVACAAGHQADWITVLNDLKTSKQIDQVGGEAKIAEIATFCPSYNNWKRYYPKLEEARYRRSLEILASDMIHKSRDRELPLADLKSWSETSVMKADYLLGEGEDLEISGSLERAVENIECTIAGQPRVGIRTGLPPLDRMLIFGLRGGDMSVLAARPAVGKTATALQIVEYAALDLNKRVLFFSLEMTGVALMERMIRSRARVSAADILSQSVSSFQKKSLASAVEEIQAADILCDDRAGSSIGYISAIARRAHQKKPLDMIVIDYLQLVRGDSKRGKENRVSEIEEISGAVKGLAKTLNVPVLVLAQLNRDVTHRGGRPSLSDLKGSGAIEQDSDQVILLHTNEEDAAEFSVNPEIELILAKHREGVTGVAKMTFEKSICRLANYNSDTPQ